MNKRQHIVKLRFMRTLLAGILICIGINSLKAQVSEPLDRGLPGAVAATCVHDQDLYVLYAVDTTAFQEEYAVARWNGLFWSYYPGLSAPPIVTTENGQYRFTSLAWYNGSLYAGGTIVDASSTIPVNHLYRWNEFNQKWNVINGAIQTMNYGILDMTVYQNELVVAGLFDQAQGRAVSNITKFNGSNWSYIGTSGNDQGTNGLINDLFIHRNRLYIAGAFSQVGATITGNTAFWTGTAWGGIGNPFGDYTFKLAATGDTLYALGHESGSDLIKRFTGTGWLKLDSFADFTRYYPKSLEGENGRLWIGGYFEKDGRTSKLLACTPSIRMQSLNPAGQISGLSIYRQQLLAWGDLQSFGNICKYRPGTGCIQGFIYRETNENCQRDSQETSLRNRALILRSGTAEYMTLSDSDGSFAFYVPPGAYELLAARKKHWESACGLIVVNNIPGTITRQDVAMHLIPDRTDLRLKLVSLNPSGMDTDRFIRFEVTLGNLGSNAIRGATLHFFHDKRLQRFSSQPPASNYMNAEAVWSLPEMTPGSVSKINMRVRVPEGMSDQEVLSAWVRTGTLFTSSDLDVSDNQDTLKLTPAGAPGTGNVKSASPEAFILPQTEYLTYTIHYRNNTDFKTSRYSIVDTIDLNLPVEFLETVAWSHNYRLRVVDGRIAVFTMDPGVLLPSEQSDSLSRGYFSYRIKVKPNLATGTEVYNTAQISFDTYGNSSTNRTLHVYTNPSVGVRSIQDATGFRVFPNPANGSFTIENGQPFVQTFILYNVQGMQMGKVRLAPGEYRKMEMSGLPAGIYLLQGGASTVKLMLERR
jgi:hypothetical protein